MTAHPTIALALGPRRQFRFCRLAVFHAAELSRPADQGVRRSLHFNRELKKAKGEIMRKLKIKKKLQPYMSTYV
jgi:hypothetical protein